MDPQVARDRLPAFLQGLPKAELHLHIEGTLEPEQSFALAARNGVALPYASVNELRAAYAFRDLQSFLDLYYAGAAVLKTARDFHDLARAYLDRAAGDGVVRAEIFFDPQTHTARGVPLGEVLDGLTRACDEARAGGVSTGLILCFLRHLPEAEAFATLEEALPYRDRLLGVGLDSSERGHPPEKFTRVFARCRQLGLHVVAHAGEEGPASYIAGALDVLGAERIDHGVRCVEDPTLVARLVRDRIPLTVCPLSNVRLRVFTRMEDHVMPELLRAGAMITINSDDPAFFGGYVNRNFTSAFEALGFDAAVAVRLARNSLEAAFLEPQERAGLLERLDAYVETFDRG
ncbi:MAG TPA: adenosine deaminase [Anaeromyxobacter sp.]|nr:adenosine deaminase [Anaeromyxobacter sp.]